MYRHTDLAAYLGLANNAAALDFNNLLPDVIKYLLSWSY